MPDKNLSITYGQSQTCILHYTGKKIDTNVTFYLKIRQKNVTFVSFYSPRWKNIHFHGNESMHNASGKYNNPHLHSCARG